jgi:hypothetical protein
MKYQQEKTCRKRDSAHSDPPRVDEIITCCGQEWADLLLNCDVMPTELSISLRTSKTRGGDFHEMDVGFVGVGFGGTRRLRLGFG